MEFRTITFLLFSLLSVRMGQGWYTTPAPSALQCGGDLTNVKGEFTSPNYPGNYPNLKFCQWRIIFNVSNSVYLNFTSLRLENEVSCRYDSVSVYDGPSPSFRLLAKMCGQQNRSFISAGPTLTVVFQSDDSVTNRGFHAIYEEIPGSRSCRNNCGYVTGNCSCTSSCRYYSSCCSDYYAYCEATTNVTVPPTSYGSCRYNCGYDIGTCSCHSSCVYYGNCCHDYNMYCGNPPYTTEPSPSYGSCMYNCGSNVGNCSCRSSCVYYGNCCHDYNMYCGATSPEPSPSYGSCMYNCGYNVGNCSCSSSCVYNGICCHDYYMYCGNTTAVPTAAQQCGGVLTDPIGEFTSPNYPGYYPSNEFCHWLITFNGSNRVYLNFTSLTLEYHTSCIFDSVSVYDGPSTSYRLLAKMCGRQLHSFISTGHALTVVFQSDGSVTDRGFHASYGEITGSRSCRNNCGYVFGNCSCIYSCRYYGNCCSDYYVYCGATSPEPSPSYGSCMYNCGSNVGNCSCRSSCVYYGNCCRDYYMYCGNPTAVPTEIPQCGGNLYGSGAFYSPYYPNYYHNNAYCLWYISAPSGQQVVLTITDIQLENCCSCDYIEVYDGPSLSSRPLGKVCFNETMAEFHSSSEHLTVLFRSDGSVVSRGFRADFTSSLPDSAGRVDCSSDNMNIVIQTSYLNSLGYSGYDLYLNDQYCRPSVSYSQVVFSFALDTCGTRREFNNGRIVYTNGVRAYRSQYGEITRQSHFTLQVLCRMEQDATAQIMYVSREYEAGNITGSGRFNVTMAFYTSGSFYYPVYDSPYVVSLNQYLYVQVRPRTTDGSLVLFLDTCVASPSPHDFTTRSYDLVRNGCRRDSTYYAYSSGSREVAQFRFRAFAFLRSHPEVYMQCKVAICRANDNSSRCAQGCRTRKARSLRSAANGETATFVLGPIQLGDPKKPEEAFPEESVAQMDV